jgi:hypothetical protein
VKHTGRKIKLLEPSNKYNFGEKSRGKKIAARRKKNNPHLKSSHEVFQKSPQIKPQSPTVDVDLWLT